jgi:hypothetical protein
MWPNGREESTDTKLGMDDFSLPGPYLLGGMRGSCAIKYSIYAIYGKAWLYIAVRYMYSLLTVIPNSTIEGIVEKLVEGDRSIPSKLNAQTWDIFVQH